MSTAIKLSMPEEILWNLCKALNITGSFLILMLSPPRTMGQMFTTLDELMGRRLTGADREQFAKALYRLKRGGYIKVKNLEGKKAVMITRDGLEKAFKASFKIETKKKRKDSKWEMLIFDIPTNQRRSRNLLRSILQNLGYKMFQQSVWVTPYDVSDKTEKLLQYYALEKYVKLFLIEEM